MVFFEAKRVGKPLGGRAAPGPAGGAYSALPDPPAGFEAEVGNGREAMGVKGRKK